MKKNKNKEELVIFMTNSLNQLRGKLGNSDETDRVYNRMLINKAHMKKELSKGRSGNRLGTIIEKLFKPKKEKLICDYFHS